MFNTHDFNSFSKWATFSKYMNTGKRVVNIKFLLISILNRVVHEENKRNSFKQKEGIAILILCLIMRIYVFGERGIASLILYQRSCVLGEGSIASLILYQRSCILGEGSIASLILYLRSCVLGEGCIAILILYQCRCDSLGREAFLVLYFT